MKNLFKQFCLTSFIILLSVKSFSQETSFNDTIISNRIIQKKIEELSQKNILKTVSIFDDTGRIFIIWKAKNKVKFILINSNEKTNKSKIKCLRKYEDLIENMFEKPDLIYQLSNKVCNDKAHSYLRVTIRIKNNNDVFQNYFYSHCEQDVKLSKLKELYFYLTNMN